MPRKFRHKSYDIHDINNRDKTREEHTKVAQIVFEYLLKQPPGEWIPEKNVALEIGIPMKRITRSVNISNLFERRRIRVKSEKNEYNIWHLKIIPTLDPRLDLRRDFKRMAERIVGGL